MQGGKIFNPFKEYSLIPAIVTPMRAEYSVDLDQMEKYVKWLLNFDIGGLAVAVDTGEGPQLYRDEKLAIVKLVSSVVKGRVPVVVGLQAINTFDAIEMAKQLRDSGADAFLVFPHSLFIGHPNEDVIYMYHKALSDSIDVPLVVFNLQPELGGVEYTPKAIELLSSLRTVVAIKEASFNAKKFLDIVRVIKRLGNSIMVLTGNDNFIYESLVMGARGGLLGFGTIAVGEQVEMFRLVAKRRYDEALEIWEMLVPLMEVVFAPPVRNYRARLKEALTMMGVLETAYVRPPLHPISSDERERIRGILKQLKFI
ncbi:MAG: dihydrodipicolinate synthase family protein [Ignisphaera sp.]